MARRRKSPRKTSRSASRAAAPRGQAPGGDVLVTQTTLYRVLPNTPVTLEIVIGEAQVGGSALTLNGAPIQVDNTTHRAVIGRPGQNLIGSVLQCATTVQDINPATNKTSVTHDFTGGVNDQSFPFGVEVAADSGLARYLITFLFTA